MVMAMRVYDDVRSPMLSNFAKIGLHLAIVLAIQALVTSLLAVVLGTWIDEEYTLATTARGIGYAFHRAIDYELQAPFYFVVLAALRTLSHAVVFARAISVAFALGFTYAMAQVARTIAPRRPAWVFAAIVALNPFTIFVALEIRLYALALVLSALAWLAFDRGFFSGDCRRARVAFVTVAIVSLYTQYFIGLELAGFAIGLVVLGRWRALRDYCISGAIAALAFVPMLVILRKQIGEAFSVPSALPGSKGSLLVHPLLDFAYPVAYRAIFPGATRVAELAGFALLAAAILIGRPRPSRRLAAYVSIAVTVEACYLIIAYGFHYELFIPRHFVALFVPEAIAAYAIVDALTGIRARACAIAIAGILALTAFASDIVTYRSLAKTGDWRRVGEYLTARTRPGDTVAVYLADSVPAFRRYYAGAATVVAFPRPLDPDRYAVAALFTHSEREAATALARLPRTGRTWLVRFLPCPEGDPYGCHELEDALASNERVLERADFFENTVVRFAPKR